MSLKFRTWLNLTVLIAALSATPVLAASPIAGDTEAATHGDEAASLQLVKETEKKDTNFVFHQYNLSALSHYSYLIGNGGEAMIVDPARDISRYLKDAQELGLKITKVYLTHSHADFVAGHMELAKATGAEIIINKTTEAGFPHKPVKDGDVALILDLAGQVGARRTGHPAGHRLGFRVGRPGRCVAAQQTGRGQAVVVEEDQQIAVSGLCATIAGRCPAAVGLVQDVDAAGQGAEQAGRLIAADRPPIRQPCSRSSRA